MEIKTKEVGIEDKQEEILQKELKAQFQLKYLVIPEELYKRNDLNWTEIRILAFLLNYNRDKFYFSNEQLAKMFNLSEKTISVNIASLIEKGLIKADYEIKSGGGKIRFLQVVKSDFTTSLSQTLQGCKVGFENSIKKSNENMLLKDNKIKDNKIKEDKYIYTSSQFSNENCSQHANAVGKNTSNSSFLSKKKKNNKDETEINQVIRELLKYFDEWFRYLFKVGYTCEFKFEFELLKRDFKRYLKEKKTIEKTKNFFLDLIDIYFNEIKQRIEKGFTPNPSIKKFHTEISRMIILHSDKSYKFDRLEVLK
jgi:predicted transcriptional regulator